MALPINAASAGTTRCTTPEHGQNAKTGTTPPGIAPVLKRHRSARQRTTIRVVVATPSCSARTRYIPVDIPAKDTSVVPEATDWVST